MTLTTYYEDGDVYYGKSVNWVNSIIANTVDLTYNSDGTVNVITETVDSSAIVNTASYTSGLMSGIVETRDSKTITYTITRNASDQITDIDRTVA